MTLKKFILIFALFIGISGMIKAQNQYGTWTSVGLEKKTGNASLSSISEDTLSIELLGSTIR